MLLYAILGSLALHGMLLFGLSMEREAARGELPVPPLEARLVEPPPPPLPKVEPPQPKVERVVKPKPRPRPKPKPAPVAKPAPQAPPAEPPPEPAAEPAAPPSVARVEPRPAPPGPSAGELEARERDAYRRAVMDAARRHNRYPPLARENNWEGEVQVGMVIGPDGAVSLTIRRSSKHAVLDRQALEMFRRAQAQVPLPASLRGKQITLDLRAIYNLRDQGSG